MKNKNYKLLSDIEHVLLRPARYIGSVKTETRKMFLLKDDKITEEEISFNFGFNKLFDEIISNSIDEAKRNLSLNKIVVRVNTKENKISVFDNGGISTEVHKETGLRIPELIFGNLKAGSNFDDTEERTGSGTHGEGSTLVNIFSNSFIVETSDGKNKYWQEWKDSMSDKSEPIIKKSKDKFTNIIYSPKLGIFGIKSLEEQIEILKFRVLECQVCNPTLSFELYIDDIKIESFDSIKNLSNFSSLINDKSYFYKGEGIEFSLSLSDKGFQQISFANYVRTYDGGTHLNVFSKSLIKPLTEYLSKKLKIKSLKESDVQSKLFIVLRTDVKNTSWTSQAKEKLDVAKENLLFNYELTNKEIKKIVEAIEIEQEILDWFKKKSDVEEQKSIRKLNASLKHVNPPGLIDAKSKDREKCRLLIFEGNSALSAVRKLRNPEFIGAFPLRGKFMNVINAKIEDILANKEALNLAASIGLKFGEPVNFKKLRYTQIEICTDADMDGISIAAQLIAYFYKFWPELFEKGMIYKSQTPLYVVKDTKNIKEQYFFYTQDTFNDFINKSKSKNLVVSQKKGLAALEDKEYSKMLDEPELVQLNLDDLTGSNIDSWFGTDSQKRKDKLI